MPPATFVVPPSFGHWRLEVGIHVGCGIWGDLVRGLSRPLVPMSRLGGRSTTMLETELADPDLMGTLVQGDAHAELANAAWAELHRRHYRYLAATIWAVYGPTLKDPHAAADLASQTLRRAVNWATRQASAEEVVARFRDASPEIESRRVRGWMGAIANRLFLDLVRRTSPTTRELHEEVEHHFSKNQREVEESPTRSRDRELLKQAVATLSPDDREAITVSLTWYDPDKGIFDVPSGEAAAIAKTLGTTTDALRQRRSRAMRRLKEAIEVLVKTEGETHE